MKSLILGLGFALVICASPVLAQTLPGSAEPGRIGARFEAPPEPAVQMRIKIPEKPAEAAPEDADALRFTLGAVALDGDRTLAKADPLALVRAKVGQEVSLADLNALAEAMTAHIRNEGYILSQIILPPQTVDGGTVKFRAIAGFIDEVAFDGAPPERTKLWDQWAGRLKAARPLDIATLERVLLIAGDLPGATVTSRLEPSPEGETGAARLIMTLKRKRADAFLQIDNRGSKSTGQGQARLSAGVNSDHGRIAIDAIGTSQIEELRYGKVTFSRMLGSDGWTLSISAARTVSEPGDTLKVLETFSTNNAVSGELNYPLIRGQYENLRAFAVIDYSSSKTDLLATPTTRDRLRSVTLGVNWDKADSYSGVNLVEAKLVKGLDILNASCLNSSLLSRARGSADFFKFEAYASRRQRLPYDFSLTTGINGQWAAHALLAGAEFGYGGTPFGRAYDSSEITGDSGLAGGLRLDYGGLDVPYIDYLLPFAYWDAGVAWNRGGGAARTTAASAGLGTRFGLLERIDGEVEIAWPLTRAIAAMGDTDPRLFFSLSSRF